MDKALFRAYVRELVKEMIEEEVSRVLPKILGEAVAEVRALQETTTTAPKKAAVSRNQLAQLMGLERHGDTIMATTDKVMPNLPKGVSEDNPAVQAINRDYSAVMKAMGLTK